MSIGAELGLIQKHSEDSMGEFELRTPVGLPKATARVDSRLKLTLILVNSSVSQLITCDKLTI